MGLWETYKDQGMPGNFIHEQFLSQLIQSNRSDDSPQKSNQALHASALVGRQVLLESNRLYLRSLGQARGIVDIPSGLNQLNLFISKESNERIKTLTLDHSIPGFVSFCWDGRTEENNRVKEGEYLMEVHALCEGREVVLKPMIYVNVNSVCFEQNGEDLRLNTAEMGSVSLDEVRHILV